MSRGSGDAHVRMLYSLNDAGDIACRECGAAVGDDCWSDSRRWAPFHYARCVDFNALVDERIGLGRYGEFRGGLQSPGKRARAARPLGGVYLVQGAGMLKIGTSGSVRDRVAAMQSGSPVRLHLLATIPGGHKVERAMHRRFSQYRRHGEWFEDCPEIRAAFGVT